MRRSEFLQRSAVAAALLVLGVRLKNKLSTYGVGIYGLAVYGGRRHGKGAL